MINRRRASQGCRRRRDATITPARSPARRRRPVRARRARSWSGIAALAVHGFHPAAPRRRGVWPRVVSGLRHCAQAVCWHDGVGAMTKSWCDVLPIDPAAEPFPLMTPDELQALGEDIKKNDLKIPVTVWGGKGKPLQLLDGRNRLDAMEAVGIPIKRLKHFIEYYCEEPMVWETTQREQNAMAAPAVISE